MINNAFQKVVYKAIDAVLPFDIHDDNILIEHATAYSPSCLKIHDFAVGVMAAFGSVVEHIGVVRGLASQTLKLNRRHCGLLLNSGQMHFLNGYGTLMDTWPIGPDNGTYRTKDERYVTMVGLHPHLRDGLLSFFHCENSAQAFQAAVEKKNAQQLEDEAAGLGLPLGMMRSNEEWLDHPQGEATQKHGLIDIDNHLSGHGRKLGVARHRPLEGVRIIELTHLVAGPTIGRLLAEQGAEVIKVQPPLGDWVLPLWLDVSWGKRNILLDIKSRSGRARFIELLTDADVLISSQRPDSLARLGFDDKSVQEINPNLVFTSASCFARSTAWETRRGFEQIAQSVTGTMHIHSAELPEPTLVSVLMNDYLTGYMGAIGTIAALAEREEKGGFWRVSASLTRCSMMANTLLEPRNNEQYSPASIEDLIDFAIDQETPWGTFTRLAPAVEFSHIPSMALRPTSWPGTDADTIGWTPVASSDPPPQVPHYPSRRARTGGIRNLIPCYGIEDRGDGGGGLSLASRQLMELFEASRK